MIISLSTTVKRQVIVWLLGAVSFSQTQLRRILADEQGGSIFLCRQGEQAACLWLCQGQKSCEKNERTVEEGGWESWTEWPIAERRPRIQPLSTEARGEVQSLTSSETALALSFRSGTATQIPALLSCRHFSLWKGEDTKHLEKC